ncbi:MAG: SDR family oxidoreductase [Thermoleophilia bacterium]|nr:SDR family oxidoreductase [Thermoleophilia bacterium]
MAERSGIVVVGGTSGIGREVARAFVERGREVVLTGRDAARARAIAEELGGGARGLALDLAQPELVAAALADVGAVEHLVLAAIERDENSARAYDVARATRLVTLKLVGYTEVVHTLAARLTEHASVVVFGGLARDRPYPGSTTITTVNGGVSALVRTLAVELAPVRFNAIHPGIVGDSPAWSGKPAAVLDGVRARTPGGQLARMEDVVDAVRFLLENRAVNGVNLDVDGGWLLT